jgi:hypothetical protein
MFDRSDILRAAWARYRATVELCGATAFSRKRFAFALRMAWADAKLRAHVRQQMVAEAAEAQANPLRAKARSELLDLQMKDRWAPSDYDRASSLNHAIAA